MPRPALRSQTVLVLVQARHAGRLSREELNVNPRPTGDTAETAAMVQAQVLRRHPPLARLELAWEMSEAARGLLRARLQGSHQDWSAAKVDLELRRLLLPTPLPR